MASNEIKLAALICSLCDSIVAGSWRTDVHYGHVMPAVCNAIEKSSYICGGALRQLDRDGLLSRLRSMVQVD